MNTAQQEAITATAQRPRMISIAQLTSYVAAFDEAPARTTKLKQRIRIGTGFHNKWYRSQHEHLLGWLVVQEAQARKNGADPATVDTRAMWNRLKCSPLMFWLAEAAGVSDERLAEAERAAEAAAQVTPKDGDPHGRLMRKALPWDAVAAAILSSHAAARVAADADARLAFDRLTSMVPAYRPLREWAR